MMPSAKRWLPSRNRTREEHLGLFPVRQRRRSRHLPNTADNAPGGFKGQTYEGGVRVPFVVSWPGHLPSGKDYPGMVSSLDIFPTALALAGVPLPADKPLDGVNLVPFLNEDNRHSPHARLFCTRPKGNRDPQKRVDMWVDSGAFAMAT